MPFGLLLMKKCGFRASLEGILGFGSSNTPPLEKETERRKRAKDG
jgi:hypothetical protein